MALSAPSLRAFFAAEPSVIRVALTRVRGSSPRDAGTEMFVGAGALWGTIGGGQLEYIAIDAARAMLREGVLARALDLPLGPEIGQCCGGRVELSLTRLRRCLRCMSWGRVMSGGRWLISSSICRCVAS
jgi:xanthine dehydrogenase accessory factor